MSKKEAKTSVGSYCSRCVTVSTDWQFLAVSESFLGFLGSKNHVDAIFSMRGFTKKNFSSKFQFWEKMMPAPPRSKLVQRIWGCGHIQYSSKMLKIGFVFLGNWFRVTDLLLGTVFWLWKDSEITAATLLGKYSIKCKCCWEDWPNWEYFIVVTQLHLRQTIE